MLRNLLLFAALAVSVSAQERLSICLLLDLRTMTSEQAMNARAYAVGFVERNMTASDSISVMTFGTELKVLQNMTGDREAVLAALRSISPSAASPVKPQNIFEPMDAAAKILEPMDGKKQLWFYSAVRDDHDNDSNRGHTILMMWRANVAVYVIDAAH